MTYWKDKKMEEEEFMEFIESDNIEDYCMKDTPYATRNQNGVVTFFDTVEEAIADFIGYEGYRLDIEINSAVIYIHRDELPVISKAKPGSLAYDNPSASVSYEAKVVVSRKQNEQ
jgi:hypothetical protein